MHAPNISEASLIPAKAGIGLRFQHHQVVLDTRPEVAWMEVHTENYMGGGTPLRYLDAISVTPRFRCMASGSRLGAPRGLIRHILSASERSPSGLSPA